MICRNKWQILIASIIQLHCNKVKLELHGFIVDARFAALAYNKVYK